MNTDTIILVLCYIVLSMELHIHWNTMGIQTWEWEQDTKTGQGLVKQRRQRDEVHNELDPKFEEE